MIVKNVILLSNFLVYECLMRNKNDRNEFKEQRDAEIMAAYRHALRIYGGKTDVNTLYGIVCSMPSSRFFVSVNRALRIVIKMINGENIDYMKNNYRRMYNEIFIRVKEELAKNNSLSVRKAVAKVVGSPAPEMYISKRQVAYIIGKEKRKCYEERKRRLRHCF